MTWKHENNNTTPKIRLISVAAHSFIQKLLWPIKCPQKRPQWQMYIISSMLVYIVVLGHGSMWIPYNWIEERKRKIFGASFQIELQTFLNTTVNTKTSTEYCVCINLARKNGMGERANFWLVRIAGSHFRSFVLFFFSFLIMRVADFYGMEVFNIKATRGLFRSEQILRNLLAFVAWDVGIFFMKNGLIDLCQNEILFMQWQTCGKYDQLWIMDYAKW